MWSFALTSMICPAIELALTEELVDEIKFLVRPSNLVLLAGRVASRASDHRRLLNARTDNADNHAIHNRRGSLIDASGEL